MSDRELADRLFAYAKEFRTDCNYGTVQDREAFRAGLLSAMYAAGLRLGHHAGVIAERANEISGLGLSCRVLNALKNEGLTTIIKIARAPDQQLLRIPNFGKGSLKELRAVVPSELSGRRFRVRVPAVMERIQ